MQLPFGVSAMTYTYARYSLAYALKSVSGFGLSEVEIWGHHPHAPVPLLDKKYLEQINRLLAENSLTVSMFTPEQLGAPVAIGSSNPLIREYSIRYFCKAADAAAAMGTRRMLMTSGTLLRDEDPEQVWQQALKSLQTIADHARSQGVSLVLEPLAKDESPLLCDLSQLKEAYDALAGFDPQVMVDLVPMHLNGENLADYFQTFGKDLSVIHFIDCDGSTIKHLVPGDGVIDFPEIVRTMSHHNFTGSLSMELGDTYHSAPDHAVQRGLDVLHKLLAENW
jgi:fructoselysine 3-epimerase